MTTTKPSPSEVTQRGREIYERRFRSSLEPQNNGKFIVIDIMTEDFEVDSDDIAAEDRLVQRNPGHALFLHCIGTKATFSFGRAM